MGILPNTFKDSQESPNVSYNYTDLAEGTGVIVFYGSTVKTQTTTSYILTQEQSQPDTQFTYQDATTTTGAEFSKNFDLSAFNLPKNIKGTAYITWACQAFKAGAANSNVSFNLTFKIQKYSGSATTIVSGTTPTISSRTATDNPIYARRTGAISLAVPLTHFKKGETLRLFVSGCAVTSASADKAIQFFHDPTDSDINNEDNRLDVVLPYAYEASGTDNSDIKTTQLKAYIPFVIDL